MASKSLFVLPLLFFLIGIFKTTSLVSIINKDSQRSILNSFSNKNKTDPCKGGSVNEKCLVCLKSEEDELERLIKRFEKHKNKDEIIKQLQNKYSCFVDADRHDFHDGCSVRNPCPYSTISILPPPTEDDWCYFSLYAPDKNFGKQGGTTPEEILYLKGDRTTCSKNNKWTLETTEPTKDRMKNFFKYRLKRNYWKKSKLLFSRITFYIAYHNVDVSSILIKVEHYLI